MVARLANMSKKLNKVTKRSYTITISKKTDFSPSGWNYDSELKYLQNFETQAFQPLDNDEIAEEPEAIATEELEPEYLNELYHHMLASLRSQ